MTSIQHRENISVIEELVIWLKSGCERCANGKCQSLQCLQRGGYLRGNKPDYNMATCERYEQVKAIEELLDRNKTMADDDICGLCGLPGADKIAHPVLWPDERKSETGFVHAECEDAECERASDLFSGVERERFLRSL